MKSESVCHETPRVQPGDRDWALVLHKEENLIVVRLKNIGSYAIIPIKEQFLLSGFKETVTLTININREKHPDNKKNTRKKLETFTTTDWYCYFEELSEYDEIPVRVFKVKDEIQVLPEEMYVLYEYKASLTATRKLQLAATSLETKIEDLKRKGLSDAALKKILMHTKNNIKKFNRRRFKSQHQVKRQYLAKVS